MRTWSEHTPGTIGVAILTEVLYCKASQLHILDNQSRQNLAAMI